ncbi:MAG: radical SAM protein [Candidatus Omnitrophota bacterium]
MKILLVNPPSGFLIDDSTFPSLGLLYLSASLKAEGFADVQVLDLNGKEAVPEAIDADIVGFSSNTPQFPAVAQLVGRFRSINRNTKAIYVIGGPHVSARADDALQDFDAIVMGEGERAIVDIAKLYERGHVFDHDIIKRGYIKDINIIPFPDRDGIDLRKYHYLMNGRPTTTVLTSRGCPFQCAFCANNAWGKTLRMRSPENVFEEIAMLKERYGYSSFMFFDDTMTINRTRMHHICDLMGSLNVIYRCFIRSDTVDRAVLRKMRSSGCVEVGVGIESGSQRILDIVNKGETVRKNMEAIKMSKAEGLRVKGLFIIGLPGENHESIAETISFLEEADLDDVDITVYTPYPGSAIYKKRAEYDIHFKDDYEHAWFKGRPDNYSTNVSTSSLSSKDILSYRKRLEKRFKKKALEGVEADVCSGS